MTKLEELIDSFKPHVTKWDCYWDEARDADLIEEDAKKCAKIAISYSSEQNKELIEKVEKLEAESIALGLYQSKETQSQIEEKWEIINDANITILSLQQQLSEAKKALDYVIEYSNDPNIVSSITKALKNLTTNT